MIALELVLGLVVAGFVVGAQFRVFAMAPLAFVACVCAFMEAMTVGASGFRVALYIAEAALFFESAYALGAVITHVRLPFLHLGSRG